MRSIIVLMFILIFNQCKSKEETFKTSIVNKIKIGTDSTRMWVFNTKDSLLFTDKGSMVDEDIIQMITTIGEARIQTHFKYNNEIDPKVEIVINIFLTDDTIVNNYGHYFNFIDNEYSWLVGNGRYASYICYFDSMGNILNEIGSIQVDAYIDQGNMRCDLFFTTAFHHIDSVVISSSNKYLKHFIPNPYAWQPMMKSLSLAYNKNTSYCISTYVRRIKDNKRQVFIDTFHVDE